MRVTLDLKRLTTGRRVETSLGGPTIRAKRFVGRLDLVEGGILGVPVGVFVVFRVLAWIGVPFVQEQFGHDVSYIWPFLNVMAHHGLQVGNLRAIAQSNNEFYPYPFAILLAPLGLLPYAWAATLGSLIAALCLSVSIAVWRRVFPTVGRSWVAMVLLGLPGLDLILIGQLLTAIGFLGATLAAAAAMQRRWSLAGLAAVLATLRPGHLAVLALFLGVFALPRRKRDLLSLVGGFAAVATPLVLAATLLHPGWLSDWVANVRGYSSPEGVILIVARQLGAAGDVLLAALVVLVFVTLRRYVAAGASTARVSAAWSVAFAVSSMVAPTPSFYSFVYILPLEFALVWSGRRAFTLAGFLALPWALVMCNFADTAFPGAQLANLVLAAAYLCGATLMLIAARHQRDLPRSAAGVAAGGLS